MQGLPANNVLLTGARGTGKSSLIKAVLNQYAPKGLRLIEVERQELVDLPDIVELLYQRRERFIVSIATIFPSMPASRATARSRWRWTVPSPPPPTMC